ncbi:MAG: hypothetical protein AB4050_17165 [Synechococcus sp.]
MSTSPPSDPHTSPDPQESTSPPLGLRKPLLPMPPLGQRSSSAAFRLGRRSITVLAPLQANHWRAERGARTAVLQPLSINTLPRVNRNNEPLFAVGNTPSELREDESPSTPPIPTPNAPTGLQHQDRETIAPAQHVDAPQAQTNQGPSSLQLKSLSPSSSDNPKGHQERHSANTDTNSGASDEDRQQTPTTQAVPQSDRPFHTQPTIESPALPTNSLQRHSATTPSPSAANSPLPDQPAPIATSGSSQQSSIEDSPQLTHSDLHPAAETVDSQIQESSEFSPTQAGQSSIANPPPTGDRHQLPQPPSTVQRQVSSKAPQSPSPRTDTGTGTGTDTNTDSLSASQSSSQAHGEVHQRSPLHPSESSVVVRQTAASSPNNESAAQTSFEKSSGTSQGQSGQVSSSDRPTPSSHPDNPSPKAQPKPQSVHPERRTTHPSASTFSGADSSGSNSSESASEQLASEVSSQNSPTPTIHPVQPQSSERSSAPPVSTSSSPQISTTQAFKKEAYKESGHSSSRTTPTNSSPTTGIPPTSSNITEGAAQPSIASNPITPNAVTPPDRAIQARTTAASNADEMPPSQHPSLSNEAEQRRQEQPEIAASASTELSKSPTEQTSETTIQRGADKSTEQSAVVEHELRGGSPNSPNIQHHQPAPEIGSASPKQLQASSTDTSSTNAESPASDRPESPIAQRAQSPSTQPAVSSQSFANTVSSSNSSSTPSNSSSPAPSPSTPNIQKASNQPSASQAKEATTTSIRSSKGLNSSGNATNQKDAATPSGESQTQHSSCQSPASQQSIQAKPQEAAEKNAQIPSSEELNRTFNPPFQGASKQSPEPEPEGATDTPIPSSAGLISSDISSQRANQSTPIDAPLVRQSSSPTSSLPSQTESPNSDPVTTTSVTAGSPLSHEGSPKALSEAPNPSVRGVQRSLQQPPDAPTEELATHSAQVSADCPLSSATKQLRANDTEIDTSPPPTSDNTPLPSPSQISPKPIQTSAALQPTESGAVHPIGSIPPEKQPARQPATNTPSNSEIAASGNRAATSSSQTPPSEQASVTEHSLPQSAEDKDRSTAVPNNAQKPPLIQRIPSLVTTAFNAIGTLITSSLSEPPPTESTPSPAAITQADEIQRSPDTPATSTIQSQSADAPSTDISTPVSDQSSSEQSQAQSKALTPTLDQASQRTEVESHSSESASPGSARPSVATPLSSPSDPIQRSEEPLSLDSEERDTSGRTSQQSAAESSQLQAERHIQTENIESPDTGNHSLVAAEATGKQHPQHHTTQPTVPQTRSIQQSAIEPNGSAPPVSHLDSTNSAPQTTSTEITTAAEHLSTNSEANSDRTPSNSPTDRSQSSSQTGKDVSPDQLDKSAPLQATSPGTANRSINSTPSAIRDNQNSDFGNATAASSHSQVSEDSSSGRIQTQPLHAAQPNIHEGIKDTSASPLAADSIAQRSSDLPSHPLDQKPSPFSASDTSPDRPISTESSTHLGSTSELQNSSQVTKQNPFLSPQSTNQPHQPKQSPNPGFSSEATTAIADEVTQQQTAPEELSSRSQSGTNAPTINTAHPPAPPREAAVTHSSPGDTNTASSPSIQPKTDAFSSEDGASKNNPDSTGNPALSPVEPVSETAGSTPKRVKPQNSASFEITPHQLVSTDSDTVQPPLTSQIKSELPPPSTHSLSEKNTPAFLQETNSDSATGKPVVSDPTQSLSQESAIAQAPTQQRATRSSDAPFSLNSPEHPTIQSQPAAQNLHAEDSQTVPAPIDPPSSSSVEDSSTTTDKPASHQSASPSPEIAQRTSQVSPQSPSERPHQESQSVSKTGAIQQSSAQPSQTTSLPATDQTETTQAIEARPQQSPIPNPTIQHRSIHPNHESAKPSELDTDHQSSENYQPSGNQDEDQHSPFPQLPRILKPITILKPLATPSSPSPSSPPESVTQAQPAEGNLPSDPPISSVTQNTPNIPPSTNSSSTNTTNSQSPSPSGPKTSKREIPLPEQWSGLAELLSETSVSVTPPTPTTSHSPPSTRNASPPTIQPQWDETLSVDSADSASPDTTEPEQLNAYLDTLAREVYNLLRLKLERDRERNGNSYTGRLPW